MKRRRKPILGFVLPILLGLVLTAWARSTLRWDMVAWSDSSRFVYLLSSAGRVSFIEQKWDNGTAWRAGWSVESGATPSGWDREGRAHDGFRFAGLEWSDQAWWPAIDNNQIFASYYVPPHRIIAVPYWLITVVLSSPLLHALLVARRRRRRSARQLCPDCGYDLRATPRRCPECGASETTHATPAAGAAIS
jgi:hypothetical protein